MDAGISHGPLRDPNTLSVRELKKSLREEGGLLKDPARAFKQGEKSVTLEDWRGKPLSTWKAVGTLDSADLEAGFHVAAFYDDVNQGVAFDQIVGFSVTDADHYSPVAYRSARELLTAYGAKSLADLESQQKGSTRFTIRVIMLDQEENGPHNPYYIYQGKWCKGSGAEPLEFLRIEKAGE